MRNSPPLTHAEMLRPFIEGQRPRELWSIGIEHEALVVRPNGAPVPYRGRDGIAALLERLLKPEDTPHREGADLIGMARTTDKISVEPGGQFELAAAPAATMRVAREMLLRHQRTLRALGEELDMRFIAGGFRPFGTLDDVSWLPKQRYEIMRRYLPTRGKLALEMMKRTATIQANFDYADEADAASRMRTAMGLSSVVTAMAASSPITEGRANGYYSYRAEVWTQMDEDRCGLLPFVFDTQSIYTAYLEWAQDVPMFFIARDGILLPAKGMNFRQFLRQGLEGHTATLDDWTTHLSTVFPEVRLKRTIEVRGADAAPMPIALAVCTLWRGILDDEEARDAAYELVADLTWAERQETRLQVPRAGLNALLGRERVGDVAVRLSAIAREGLRRLARGAAADDDRVLLDPLDENLAAGRVPADRMLEDLEETGGDPAALVQRWRHPVD